MRIYGPKEGVALPRVILLLTPDEAGELRDLLCQQLDELPAHTHYHVVGLDGVSLEVELYGPEVEGAFSPRAQRLIDDNE